MTGSNVSNDGGRERRLFQEETSILRKEGSLHGSLLKTNLDQVR